MNPCLPEWNIEAEVAVPHQNKPKGFDDELVELLWRNGEVVLHSQTHKKSGYDPNECKHEQTIRANVIQYDETVSWLNCPVDDSFENSPFLPDKQSGDHKIEFGFDPLDINHIIIPQSHYSGFGFDPNPMPPPRSHSYVKDASHSGSNQVVNDGDTSRFSAAMMTDYTRTRSDTMERDTFEPANTSSSGGSGSSYARTCDQSTATNGQSHKRKSREGEEPECQSKAGEQGSVGGNKSAQKSGITRRSRAAQVHNLSERRRRDRINEKMKALQELLPRSTKTDKASMLDEAIEYLKSLQIQLQMMWMGSGMASMMFPGVQHYMSRMGMGMGMQNAMHLARLPLVDPAIPTSMVNYPNFPDQYPAYMGFHPIHASSQPMNMCLGSHTALQNQQLPHSNGSAPTS